MPIAALVTWIITALIGSFMLIRWVSRGGLRRQGAAATHFPPARVFTHFGLAAAGLILWISYLVTGSSVLAWIAFVFFFQAEDGIRDIGVPGVQTCALPISELAVLGRVHPADRAGVPAAVETLEIRDRPECPRARLPPDRGRWMQVASQLDRRAGLGELRVDRRSQVLDVGHLDELGLRCRLDPDRVGPHGALDPADHDLVLGAVLGRSAELFPQVIVNGRVGASAR